MRGRAARAGGSRHGAGGSDSRSGEVGGRRGRGDRPCSRSRRECWRVESELHAESNDHPGWVSANVKREDQYVFNVA
jgi:hypothetical protein